MEETVQPINRLEYIPVGTVYTRETLGNVSLRDLQNRSLYDPRYAGFEPNFNWHDYVDVRFVNPQIRRQVEASLNQYSSTPEGQHILRQALAMQVFRDTGRVLSKEELLTPEAHRHRIKVQDYRISHGRRVLCSDGSQFNDWRGRILLDREQINSSEYLTAAGGYENFTVQETLFHELGHAADALCTPHNKRILEQTHATYRAQEERDSESLFIDKASYDREKAQPAGRITGYELFDRSPLEYPAMRAASDFTHKHYGAPEQLIRYSYSNVRPDPDGGTHYYNGMTVSPARTPDASANNTPAPKLPGI